MTQARRVRTTLYDDQRLLPWELDLLHTPTLQRLYDLRQLGLTDRVFLDASHVRIHHTVGTLEQVDRLASAIAKNLRHGPAGELRFGSGERYRSVSAYKLAREVEELTPVVRLMAMLHDISHAPYGHTLEDEVRLIRPGHDDPARQADAFQRLLCEYIGWAARDAGVDVPDSLARYLDEPITRMPPDLNDERIVSLVVSLLHDGAKPPGWIVTRAEMARVLAQLHMAMTALLHLKNLPNDRHVDPRPQSEYPSQRAITAWLERSGKKELGQVHQFDLYRHAWMLDVVGNTVCADLLDYAKRDARNAGIKLDFDDKRIAENFTIVSWSPPRTETDGSHQQACYLRAAICVFSHKLRTDVPGELMNLLNVRFYLYERAVYHATKCAADAMLGTALQLLGLAPWQAEAELDPDIRAILARMGDAMFLHTISEAARLALLQTGVSGSASPAAPATGDPRPQPLTQRLAVEIVKRCYRPDQVSPARQNAIGAAADLLSRLQARRYYRPIFRTLPNYNDQYACISANDLANTFADPIIRFRAEREIEKRQGLRLGSVVIHCPRPTTAQKIAGALIVNRTSGGNFGQVIRLDEIQELEPSRMFEKHAQAIKAVEDMYKSMWRLVVYVAPCYLERAREIADQAGQVLWKKAVRPSNTTRASQQYVSNDPMLELELRCRQEVGREEELAPAADVTKSRYFDLIATVHPLMKAEELKALLRDLNSPEGDGVGALIRQFGDDEFGETLQVLKEKPDVGLRLAAREEQWTLKELKEHLRRELEKRRQLQLLPERENDRGHSR